MLANILGAITSSPTKIIAPFGELSVDVLQSYEYNYEQTVTSHPVETGFEIQDNIVNSPKTITLVAGISSMPVTYFWENGVGKNKVANAQSFLEKLRDSKELVSIFRQTKLESDYVLTSIHYSKSTDNRTTDYFDLTFQKIVKVVTETAEIPEDIVAESQKENVGKTAQDGGAATQQSISMSGGNDVGAGMEMPSVSDTIKNDLAGSMQSVKDAVNSDESLLYQIFY